MTVPTTALGFVDWEAHVEVWLLVVGVIVLGLYASRVIGPKVVTGDEPITTNRQRFFFWAGVVVLWVSSDWPMHDVSEEQLYSVHMVQHFLISFVVPPLFLLATPTWLARLLIERDSATSLWLRRLSRPVAAGVLFNAVVIFTHWPTIVNLSVESGSFHYTVHVLVVASALLMWMPVCGPIPEWRISMPAQMVYLFLMSIVPTVPPAWLTLAENPVYAAYDHGQRLWASGWSATSRRRGCS
ncbi:MAG: cytochrome c oxidase assembly protein [Acidimicrobiia bacterium]|nr:cytochrome c oxidase assembly protein [Acidimicrobiia bacterium]